MRVSRAPEGRSTKKHIAIATIGIVAVAAVVVGYLFYGGSDPISAKDAEDAGAQATVSTAPTSDNLTVTSAAPATPKPAPTAVPDPTPAPEPTPAPDIAEDTSASTDSAAAEADEESNPQPTPAPTVQASSASMPKVFPEAVFGEILEEGLAALKYPHGELVRNWYTFQVDTETKDITLFFAQYDDNLETILSTVRVDNYTKGSDLQNAEVRLNYPDGSTRTLFFNKEEGSISLNQQYVLPVGPSMLSTDTRRSLVYYGLKLQDASGDVQAELNLDLSGLSQSEGLEFTRIAPDTVNEVLRDLQFLVEQIESQRTRP
ncbi:MAG: hypothetical protein BZY75_01620 [SAR202 cluster bacterium Io17-Chloro-G7]|nr:MAG: hypothetical protein BZY75_01620 [SAR202 cluster bacterium Io17-Chloro-G7]